MKNLRTQTGGRSSSRRCAQRTKWRDRSPLRLTGDRRIGGGSARTALLAARAGERKERFMPDRSVGTRTIALVGPGGAGKTSLAEALLFAAGAIDRQGSVDAGTSVGDASAEARARGGSTELNLMHFNFMGDRFAI